MDVIADLREITRSGGGADFFGIADLTPVRDAVVAQGGASLALFTRAVSIGIALPGELVDRLEHHEDPEVVRQYAITYDETNRNLDRIAESVADYLRSAGASTLAVHASRRTDQDRLCGRFSHKMAAHLAGLGWIGKSCLLITRQAGPRVRWTTVLTDAPIPPTGEVAAPACGACRRCVDACPAQAFTGTPFHPDEGREARFDARKCDDYVTAMTRKMGDLVFCGLCMAVCPYGVRRQREVTDRPCDEGRSNQARGAAGQIS